ncbi:MAG: hypothetical protein QMC94_08625 [Anaerosomatales bacterium]|nr:hypothetical protein [Anaerosomatales bacterium]
MRGVHGGAVVLHCSLGRRGRMAVRLCALACAALLLHACSADRDVTLVPGDSFELAEGWTMTVPKGASAIAQVYGRSGGGGRPLRGVTVSSEAGSWSVDVYEAEGLRRLYGRVADAKNAVWRGAVALESGEASMVVLSGEAAGSEFHVLHVYIQQRDERPGLFLSGSGSDLEQALRAGAHGPDLLELAFEQSGLHRR